jgi:DNA-directed RNA polymerase specialized sigma24 family protein
MLIDTAEARHALPLSFLRHLERARRDHEEGDDSALDALLRRVTGKVRGRLATRLRGVPDLDDAIDEIVQDALWKLVTGMAGCRARSDAQAWAWLWTLVEHARVDYLRRERHRRQTVPIDGIVGRRLWARADDDGDGDGVSPGDRVLLECLMRACDELPPGSAALVWGRVILSMSDADLGRELGTAASAAKRRWQRLQARLRREAWIHITRLEDLAGRRLGIAALRTRRFGRSMLARAGVVLGE